MAAQVEAESVYFDFDRSFVRPEYRAVLAKKVEFLREFPEYNLRIEGNCDERGTNEYNLALGDRRADSAKSYLISLGISPERIETISYGEERPLAVGHNEGSWSQNRRDDFVLMKK
jgi:peptidoglycan-associated lipoprotein